MQVKKMTLYETIFKRRQVRKYNDTPLDKQTLDIILVYTLAIKQMEGQKAHFELVSAEEVSGGVAPHYLLSSCEESPAAYANVGYILQKVDLYIQSIGIGSGWFMGIQPKKQCDNHCITLAFGNTDIPLRNSVVDFKRLPIEKISYVDNAIAQAIRLAPSAMNSQPWKLDFADGKVIIQDVGRGIMRVVLRNKLNKIDVGIAACHAVIALGQEGKTVTQITPKSAGKGFEIRIEYRLGENPHG